MLAIFGLGGAALLLISLSPSVNPFRWVFLSPALVWHGEVWRLFSYALLPGGLIDWMLGVIWLSVLGGRLERIWSSWTFWAYCLLAAIGGAVPFLLLGNSVRIAVIGSGPLIFGLLTAWYRLCGFEDIIVLGLGRVSVRQAAIIIAIINLVLVAGRSGWLGAVCELGAPVAVWLGLSLQLWLNTRRHKGNGGSNRFEHLEV